MGIGSALAANWFAMVLVGFHREYPHIKVTVGTGISSDLVGGLSRGLFDLVVTARPEQDLPEQFVSVPLFTCQMHPVCRAGHPLRNRNPAVIADLASFGRVGFVEDREFERHARSALGGHADWLRPVVETSSLSIMLGLLAATDHFAIVSETMLPRVRQDGLDLIGIDHPLWQIDIDLMCKARFATSRPVSAIRSSLIAAAHHW
jgi:DNA-binding transcriptional LysR family regulator